MKAAGAIEGSFRVGGSEARIVLSMLAHVIPAPARGPRLCLLMRLMLDDAPNNLDALHWPSTLSSLGHWSGDLRVAVGGKTLII